MWENCAGFSGDRVDAAGPVVETLIEAGGPAAIFFEVLAERTIALAQLEKRRDPERGYEPMLELLIAPILRDCVAHGITIIGNYGAANPMGAARCIARIAAEQGLGELRIAVVEGDDIMGRIDPAGLEVIEADASLRFDAARMISANVYLGAEPVAEAMAAGAQVVVTGRIADPALALAPLHASFRLEGRRLEPHRGGHAGRASAGMRRPGDGRLFLRSRLQGRAPTRPISASPSPR